MFLFRWSDSPLTSDEPAGVLRIHARRLFSLPFPLSDQTGQAGAEAVLLAFYQHGATCITNTTGPYDFVPAGATHIAGLFVTVYQFRACARAVNCIALLPVGEVRFIYRCSTTSQQKDN